MEAILHSLIIFIVPYFAYNGTILSEESYNGDLWSISLSSFTSMMLIVTLKLMVFERFYCWINIVSISICSLGIYFLYVFASNWTGFSNTHASMQVIFVTSNMYLSVLLCVGLAYFLDIFKRAFVFSFKPTPTDYLKRAIKSNQKSLSAAQEDEFYEICGALN